MKNFALVMATALAMTACGPQREKVPALDLSSLDTTVTPGQDFYKYSTGGWQSRNPLKPEYSRYGSFDVLRDSNEARINRLFQEMSKKDYPAGSVEKKVADLYKMALDSTKRNADGAEPIQGLIAEIQAIDSKDAFYTKIGEFANSGSGSFFATGVGADLADSDMQVLYLGQSGLGMGNRDYYIDPSNAGLKAGYLTYLKTILNLAGVENADQVAENDLAFEDAIAKISWSKEQERDIEAQYNPRSTAEILAAYPNIGFETYFKARGIEPQEKVIVGELSYFEALDKLVAETGLQTLKDYTLAQAVSGATDALSDDFETARWEFFSHQMAGTQAQKPRWKRAMAVPNSILGEAVGKMYVAQYFPESSKKMMIDLVSNLRVALGEHIDALEWMGDTTKMKAHEKLENFKVKIGYPDKWKDYGTLEIDPEKNYYDNLKNASAWYEADNMSKLGKPTDKEEWGMTPQTVNAYYNPTTNEICFPAAILQPPFFNPDADEPVNYGGIGVVIGHEMSHGFDDQGRLFDKDGNMVNWWTAEDDAKFKALAEQLAAQFDKVEIAPGVHANGHYTLGENIGDHGGISIAYSAMHNAIAGKNFQPIDGFTADQRFYLSYGAIWAQNITDAEKLRLTNLDPHSLAENRVNVSVKNFASFFEAFGIEEGDPMYLPENERVHIW